MILNTILLLITIFLIYIGYTHKAIIIFFVSLIYGELYNYFSKIIYTKAKYHEKRNVWEVKFYLNNSEYIMIIPHKDLVKHNPRILAMANNKNKTNYILKLLGPCRNFWGFKVSPKEIGINKELIIWTNDNRYIFPSEEPIEFVDKYIAPPQSESSSSSSENEEN